MPTERTRQQHHGKDRSPPEDGLYHVGMDPSDPNGTANGGHRGLDQGGGGRGGGERSGTSGGGLKAKLAAKWGNRKRTDDTDKKVAMESISCYLLKSFV